MLLPDPAARTFLTGPGPAWQASPRHLRLGRQSSARTCSFGTRADDLDHLCRLYPPREIWVGRPPCCQTGQSTKNEGEIRSSFLPLLQFEIVAPLTERPWFTRTFEIWAPSPSHTSTQPDLAVLSWLIPSLPLVSVRLFLPPDYSFLLRPTCFKTQRKMPPPLSLPLTLTLVKIRLSFLCFCTLLVILSF